ncbi:MAG: RNA polymerase sigma-70 factor [Bacteroidetes bacterium]|nr:RNA polymerase sigma-70 factor [Bacteroidota bacterium]
MGLVSKYNALEERALLARIAAGDEAAFADLFHAWRDQLYTLLFRITNDVQKAEDALQDVFVRIWLRRRQMTEIEHFGSYLYRMAQNHAINGLRRHFLETLMLADLREHALRTGTAPDEALLYKQAQERLKNVIDRLPHQQRLVYKLSREQGLDRAAIADQLGLSASTIKNHMSLALKTIREELATDFPTLGWFCLLLLGEQTLM